MNSHKKGKSEMCWGGIDVAIGKSKSSSYTAFGTVNAQGMLMSMDVFRPTCDDLDERFREMFTWLTVTVLDGALKYQELERVCIAQPIVRPMKMKQEDVGKKDVYYTNRSQIDLAQTRGAISMVVGAYAPVIEVVETKVNADIIGRGNPSHTEIIAWAKSVTWYDHLQFRRVDATTANQREDRANAFKMARFAFLDYDYEIKTKGL